MGDSNNENRHDHHVHVHIHVHEQDDDHSHDDAHGHSHDDAHGHSHVDDHGHSHDHDHEHSHDHDHDDAHDHSHDDAHEHSHDDAREHSHSHDHGHDHDHEDGDEHDHEHIGTDGGINVSRHEGALILSTQIVVAVAYSRMVKAVEAALNELAAWIDARNGVVGHIKASVSENGRSSTISNTGDGVATKEFAPDITTVSMASIIFAVPEDEYCAKFEEVVESLKSLAN